MLSRLHFGNLVALIYILGQSSIGFAQTKTVEIHAEKSTIAFQVTHLGVLTVEGEFEDFTGSLSINNDRLIDLESSIEVASIYTGDTYRDKALIDVGYLDASNFPLISFRSLRIQGTPKKKLVFGQLKIRDITKDINMSYEMIIEDTYYRLKISTTLSRKEFDLDFGPMNALIGDYIKVIIDIIGKPLK